MAVTFDTLEFAREMRELGFTKEQAERFPYLLKTALDNSELATRGDLRELEHRITAQMTNLEHKLTTRIYAAQVATVIALIGVLSFFGTI